MTDPLGLIGQTPHLPRPLGSAGQSSARAGGPSFKNELLNEIGKVNELQQDATAAIEDLASGRRDDVEGVILATQKADTAFRMLLQVRNKVMDAYDEVKQIRV